MPPKARIVRKPSATASTASPKPPASSVTRPSSPSSTATGAAAGSKEGTMLPPPDPSPPKAILEPELDALAICLRNAAVKTSQVHAFFGDTKRLGIHNFVTHPPHTLTDALCREIEKYDQICDLMEAQLSRAISVLQRDLDRAKAQEQAEREAEALKNLPPPVPEVVPESNAAEPSAGSSLSVVPIDASSVSGIQKVSGAGSFLAARRQSTISLSSLSRPHVPHKLDLSADALRINSAELAQGLGGGLPSPVTLAPKSGRPTATSEFPPDFMAALAATTQPVDIDLTMLPEEGPTTTHVGLEPALGSSADRPIELDLELEGMDIDMTDVHASLFGEEPTNDVPTTNPFANTTTTVIAGGNPSQPAALLGAFNQATEGGSQAGVTALPFDMNMDDIDFSAFQLDPMMNTSEMGSLDMHALLNMESETGAQVEGQNAARDT